MQPPPSMPVPPSMPAPAPMAMEQYGNLTAIFGQPIDPNTIAPQDDFSPVPPGTYPMLIESAEIKQTKKGDGHYINLAMTVLDGQQKGRKLFDRIMIQHPNAECLAIGMKAFGAIGRAIGAAELTDTSQLLNQVVAIRVRVTTDEKYGAQNEVQKYLPPSEAQPQTGDAGLPQPTYAPPPGPPAQPVAVVPQAVGPAPAPAGPAAPVAAPAQQQAPQQAPWMRKAA